MAITYRYDKKRKRLLMHWFIKNSFQCTSIFFETVFPHGKDKPSMFKLVEMTKTKFKTYPIFRSICKLKEKDNDTNKI